MKLTTLNSTAITNPITTYFACDWSKDGHMYVLTDNVVYILRFIPQMKSRNNRFNIVSTEINLTKFFVVDHIGYKFESILNNLSKENYYASLLNTSLTPHLDNLNPASLIPVSAQWSRERMHNISSNMIAVLSNTGNLEIFANYENQWIDRWISLTNITEYWIKILTLKWEKPNDEYSQDEQYNIIKERVQQASCTSFTWSKTYEKNGITYCFLFLGHGDGNISVWKINRLYTLYKENINEAFKVEPNFVYSNKVSTDKITQVYYSMMGIKEYLVVGDIKGIIKLYPILSSDFTNFTLRIPMILWEHCDVQVSKIISMNCKDGPVIMCVKGPFIVMFHMKYPWGVRATKNINIGNLNVTDIICREPGSFLVATQTGIIKVIKLVRVRRDLAVQLIEVKTDINVSMQAVHGLMKSPNSPLWGILTYPRKLFDHLAMRNPGELTFCYESDRNPAKHFRFNWSEKLEKYWESMETIRCLSIINNIPPFAWITFKHPIDFKKISLYQLRVLYWCTQILYTVTKNRSTTRKEETIRYNLNLYSIILNFRIQILRIKWMLNLLEAGIKISQLEMESLYLLHDAVKNTWSKNGVRKVFNDEFYQIEDVLERIKTVELPDAPLCKTCQEELTGEPCTNDIDERCCIMNVQLSTSDIGWICKWCRRIAHRAIEEQLYCPLCDILLIQYVHEEIKPIGATEEYILS